MRMFKIAYEIPPMRAIRYDSIYADSLVEARRIAREEFELKRNYRVLNVEEVYNSSSKNKNDKWVISERLSHEEIKAKLRELDEQYSGKIVRHTKTNGLYRIWYFSVLNQNGTAEIAVNYHPYDLTESDIFEVKFTRPAREFFDGRFVL